MGSALKIVAGIFDNRARKGVLREQRKLVRDLKIAQANLDFQDKVFGNNEGGMYARTTRRILAVIGMVNLFIISILCTINPAKPLLTFTPPENKEYFEFLFFFKIPIGSDITTIVTTGHMALATVTILAIIVGFYFTPGGSK